MIARKGGPTVGDYTQSLRDSYRGPTHTRHDAHLAHLEAAFKLLDARITRLETMIQRLVNIIGGPTSEHDEDEDE